MFDSVLEKSNKKKGILTLKGELTIETAAELKTALQDAVNRCNAIEVAFKDVTAADLTCLQLLCSAHKSANKLKKSLTLHPEIPGNFRKTVFSLGFRRQSGCFLVEKKNCLWLAFNHVD